MILLSDRFRQQIEGFLIGNCRYGGKVVVRFGINMTGEEI